MKYSLPYIILETTSYCNLNCRYCYNIWKIPGQKNPAMNSYKDAMRTLKKIFRMADVRHVTFTGGEPLLAERIEELVLFARMKKKSVTIITNGSGADQNRYKTLISLGVELFEIPVHAHSAEIHDEITRVTGSWEKSVQSIKFMKSLGKYVVPVMVITKINGPYIAETLSFISELGCKRIMLNRYNIGGEGFRENKNILMSADELRNVYSVANQLSASLGLQLSSNVCTPFCLLNPKEYPNIAFGSCSRNLQNMPITIDIKGNLRLCNHSPIVAGNIFRNNLSEIFSDEHATNWLKNTPSFCHSCSLYQKCLGGCRSASLQAGFSENDVDPVMTFPTQEL